VVWLACKNTGATDANTAVANTWSLFSGPANVTTWDGVNLAYWGGGNATATTTADLLNNQNGQCGSWACFLIDCFRANGVTGVQKIYLTPIYSNDPGTADPDSRGTMLVKNWSFNGNGTAPSILAPFNYLTSEIADQNGVPGQNNTNPPGGFKNHFIVLYNSNYYDPSYGDGPFGSQQDWENASIDGYLKVFRVLANGVPIDFPAAKKHTSTSGLEMQFTPASY